MEVKDYIETLQETIEKQKKYEMQFYVIDESIERQVELVLTIIFQKYSKTEFAGVLFTCLKELLINAAKANLKRVFFENSGMDIDNENQYITGMMKFKDQLIEAAFYKYQEVLIKRNYWIKLSFEYNDKGVKVEVSNNSHITEIEDKRLREKLKKAMQYEDIAQFYLEQGDEIEGAGMGIALVVMLMKGLNIDPGLFRIGSPQEENTVIRIEIPMSEGFVSVRRGKN